MKEYSKFFISFVVFIALFAAIDCVGWKPGDFDIINLKVILLFVYAVFLWAAQVLPNSMISILIIVLIGLLKLDSFSNVIAYSFGNTVFIFVFSVIAISYAFSKSGLPELISQALMNRFGGSSKKILFSLMFTSYILSMFLTVIAGVSIAFPIAMQVININKLERGNRFAKSCMIGITYAGLIGGIATPLGTPVNLLMIQYLKDLGGFNLSFSHWMAIGLPLSFILLLTAFILLCQGFRIKTISIQAMESKPVRPSSESKLAIAAFSIIIALILFSQVLESNIHWLSININLISLICILMLALPPFRIIKWKDAIRNLDWDSLVFLAGSIALGYLIFNTGTASLIAGAFFGVMGDLNLYLYVFVFCLFTVILHITLSSNTVTGTIIIPILISFAQQLGVSPWYVAAPAVYCISLAFILPTESPTNIITYNSGYYEIKDMVKYGSVLTLASILIISVFLIIFGGITGLYTIG